MPNTNCLEGVKCPVCGQDSAFRIDATVTVLVTDDGTEDENGQYGWEPESFTQCTHCDKTGPLSDFTIA